MGLDMYLYKRTYVKRWDFQKAEEQHSVIVKKGDKVDESIKSERVAYVVEEVAYWRKFNALHGWFVNECADGKDECQQIYVGEQTLQKLLGILNEVKSLIDKSYIVVKVIQAYDGDDVPVAVYSCEDEVRKLFTPTEGFFFGSQEIDEYFAEDVNETISIIEGLLNESGSDGYYYQASW